MSGTSYCIEKAKSGRSNCKKCKTSIAKGELRLGVVSSPRAHDGESYSMTSWHHVPCFTLPRKYRTGIEAMSVRDFCHDVLTDASPDRNVLSEHLDEIVEQIETASSSATAPRSGGKRKSGEGEDGEGGDGTGSLLSHIKSWYDAQEKGGDENDDETPKKKKAKTPSEGATKAVKGGGVVDDEEIRRRQIEAYGAYRTLTANELKPMLAWNKQFRTGTKDALLVKCIDGRTYGRLGCCQLCGGRLKLGDDGVSVRCDGVWNEDLQYRSPCSFTTIAPDAPRFQPWYDYDAPPTEEQTEEMERLIEAAKEGDAAVGGGGGDGTAVDPDVEALIEATKAKCPFWDLSSGDKVVATATKIVEVMREHNGKRVDLPQSDQDARKAVGVILMGHKTMDVEHVIKALVKALGFVENKQAKAAQRQAAVAGAVKDSANAALVSAFTELSQYYFKEGNSNAGSATNKVATALAGLDYEITEANALGLGKGKTKVANIGAKSAEKIHEFVTTGRMEKLDEKRANHGA